jgi:hypothetical protein
MALQALAGDPSAPRDLAGDSSLESESPGQEIQGNPTQGTGFGAPHPSGKAVFPVCCVGCCRFNSCRSHVLCKVTRCNPGVVSSNRPSWTFLNWPRWCPLHVLQHLSPSPPGTPRMQAFFKLAIVPHVASHVHDSLSTMRQALAKTGRHRCMAAPRVNMRFALHLPEQVL